MNKAEIITKSVVLLSLVSAILGTLLSFQPLIIAGIVGIASVIAVTLVVVITLIAVDFMPIRMKK